MGNCKMPICRDVDAMFQLPVLDSLVKKLGAESLEALPPEELERECQFRGLPLSGKAPKDQVADMIGALETFIKANAMPQQAVHGARIPKEITEANSCYVVSHPWFAREHCDPRGEKLKALVAQLDKLRAKDDALVFIDFLSIPQEDQFEKEIVKITKNMDEDLKKLKAPPDT